MADFLLEIGTEEIPDWMIEPALVDLRSKFAAAFGGFGGDSLRTEATPRRFALFAKGLAERSPDVENLILGPYLTAGGKAAEGFARKWKTSPDQLATSTDDKGERYVLNQLTRGQSVATALAEKLPGLIASINFPKSMTWPGSEGVRFIRPIRWLVAVLDEQTIAFSLAGITSGNTTRGHRILGSPTPVPVTFKNYESTLRENGVILPAEERRGRITAGLDAHTQRDDELVGVLVYLTEFPSVLRGAFDPAFLELPKEILSTVMRHHQRYFSVLSEDGSLRPEFLAVTNTNGDPDGLIRQGNERVLRARFNDARFFWQADQRIPLVERLVDLEKVTFQAKLGSYADKTKRVVTLAGDLAKEAQANTATVERAALLAKCDLTTDMVKEFTELQGVVGGLYARAQGESEAVTDAIYDHYKPVSMDDAIPRSLEGQLVAVADKLDTLRECFKIGLIPTGSKDPFALRRAAQGVVRILFEAKLPLRLPALISDIPELAAFLRERISFYLREMRSYTYDEVNAVLAAEMTTLANVIDRVEAIHTIRPTEDFEPVAASFKRIQNILRQSKFTENTAPDPHLLKEGPERNLYAALEKIRREGQNTGSCRQKLELMASLRPQVDLFFDKILVNDPDTAIRHNRLALLSSLLREFSGIADFSEIVTQGGV
ncbi:MAG TPA: glycine--tRNA ligase subunit beta [Bryobacteraceae bacterium]|jgi:glycyl-tRNA synthetase beta chain|nr:glycine--tRNA ligase subunit beta [Bryobacteraceae bacterium]